MSTTVILFGSSGMLGNTIYEYFKFKRLYELICINRCHFDILKNNKNDLYNLFQVFPANCVIINATGLIPHSGNTNENDYYKINADFPKLLDELCNTFHHTFIHITTDCVFNGKTINYESEFIHIKDLREFKGYTENDVKNEANIYGKSKALGEELTNATIIRTSIIGEQNNINSSNTKLSLLQWVRSQTSQNKIGSCLVQARTQSGSCLVQARTQSGSCLDKPDPESHLDNSRPVIDGYCNHYWNGITCLRLAELIHKIIEKKLFWMGVRHIFTDKHISKYMLIGYINEIYNLNLNIKKIECSIEINKTLCTNHINNAVLNQYCDSIDIYQQIKDQMLFFKSMSK